MGPKASDQWEHAAVVAAAPAAAGGSERDSSQLVADSGEFEKPPRLTILLLLAA